MEDTNPKVATTQALNLPKNPVVHRGQDPELMWLGKYGGDARDDRLQVDIRSLYRHEHISPELLINGVYKLKRGTTDSRAPTLFDVFGNNFELDELEKPTSYYTHQDGWSNRLIQGDSLLVMSSLTEREGMAGKVQCIYMDPPYGIKYGSNWQMQLNKRDVKDGSDEHLTGEPEMIKAYRDTWELGIHSYLSYLRDRLLVAKELLNDSGSCYVQISDENVHLVRNLMDEVFGSENFIVTIKFFKTTGQTTEYAASTNDYILWYAKDKQQTKWRRPLKEKNSLGSGMVSYDWIEDDKSQRRPLTNADKRNLTELIEKGWKICSLDNLTSQSGGETTQYAYEFKGRIFKPKTGGWKTNLGGMRMLEKKNRLEIKGNTLRFVRYINDFPATPVHDYWDDVSSGGFTSEDKMYVVQTSVKVIQRCILMATDPGDLVLDPTCGSGTTAYVAEQWGRRWITIDTSRIAVNIAKTRLMTALFPYYFLYDEVHRGLLVNGAGNANAADIRNGFEYEKVPHITLKSLANNEPPETETLYDKPKKDNKRIRVCGPFMVETLQNFEPIEPEELDKKNTEATDITGFEQKIFQHLKSAGVKNGLKNETAVFLRVEPLASTWLHAEGFYQTAQGERKAYLHIGPQFGTVSRQAVNEAVKECRNRGGADWLIILGFSFESNISNTTETTSMGSFEVTKVRMADDLLQEGLLKKDKKAASFMTIGEPDIKLHRNGDTVQVEIAGMDIYDPMRDEVKSFNREDIAYWMVDDDYDGASFIVKQVFFCGGDDEFDKWRKALEKTVKVEIDEEAWDRLYQHISHPIAYKKGKKIAVRVISQFGEESTKVLTL